MNSDEIRQKLAKYDDFVGVFPRDRLPKKTPRPAGLVINTDKSDSPGRHWVAYYINKSGLGDYFDPLGQPVPANEIMRFVKRNSDGWMHTRYNNIAFQADDSAKCGQFCIFYLQRRLKGETMCQVNAHLSHNSNVNDSIV